MAQRRIAATFIEPMLLLRKERLPEAPDWLYEIKLEWCAQRQITSA
jgi:hypothetical protein